MNEVDISRTRTVAAGEFKAHCLRMMDEVRDRRTELIITKRGKPVARLVPVDDDMPDAFGALRGSVRYLDDIVAPDHAAWEEPAND